MLRKWSKNTEMMSLKIKNDIIIFTIIIIIIIIIVIIIVIIIIIISTLFEIGKIYIAQQKIYSVIYTN